ncbi:hypothetical protein RFI_23907 [Reticulomyxa filosa]|uniref:Cullin family profile domain-containing protein n=1 Tax=Reticulomyxa filosa TaxID=46433 RepID=X6MHI7_RETFI|nr:hypothetical protein RFI_23907 [Reticulomyxa filosa]|eukprot:ETO13463.1 hypothetical protein RFI_23907 [Reticulomyxa filosa]
MCVNCNKQCQFRQRSSVWPRMAVNQYNIRRGAVVSVQLHLYIILPFFFFKTTEQPKLEANFEANTINKLIDAIEAVFAKKAANCSFEELYKVIFQKNCPFFFFKPIKNISFFFEACQSLCTLKKGKQMYDRLFEACDVHIQQMVNEWMDVSIKHPQSFLEPLKCMWESHCEEMHAIRQVFLLLDKTYVKTSTDMKSLWSVGIHLLKKHILAKDSACHWLIMHLLQLIENERNGEQIDRELLKPIASIKYYENEGNNLVMTMSVPDYLSHVLKRLKEEVKAVDNRVKTYLEVRTQRPIVLAIETQMIKSHAKNILSKGFEAMMDESRFLELRHLYELLCNVQETDALQQSFHEYIKKRGLEVVASEAGKEMVSLLLKFKAKLDRVVNESFHNDRQFHHAIRHSWEHFLNVRQDKPAELIAKEARGTSEQELEDCLDRVMDIFRFIHGKDVFQAFYKKDFAKVVFFSWFVFYSTTQPEHTHIYFEQNNANIKRLLLNTSASEDAEKNMINRIRKECGQAFASNLENMFNDMSISRDLQTKFKAHVDTTNLAFERQTVRNVQYTNKPINTGMVIYAYIFKVSQQMANMDFQVDVLTCGCWPTYDTEPIDLPSQVQSVLVSCIVTNKKRERKRIFHLLLLWFSLFQDSFRSFYCHINSGRQLNWTVSLSHCIISAHFPKVE